MIGSNPCTYKTVCKKCKMVEPKERPKLCVDLSCEHYEPCPKCGNNAPIVEALKMCTLCVRGQGKKPVESEIDLSMDDELNLVETSQEEEFDLGASVDKELKSQIEKLSDEPTPKKKSKKISLSYPGKPPENYDEDGIEYYNRQWKIYLDYWGDDPTHYTFIHSLILAEYELLKVGHKVSISGKEDKNQLEEYRRKILQNIKSLKENLPEDSALDRNQEIKSLGEIHRKYAEEVGARKIGDLRRMFTPEAVVLNAVLPMGVDLNELIKMSGATVQEELDLKNIAIETEGKSIIEIAHLIGFPLNEEFAFVPDFYNSEIIDAIEARKAEEGKFSEEEDE